MKVLPNKSPILKYIWETVSTDSLQHANVHVALCVRAEVSLSPRLTK